MADDFFTQDLLARRDRKVHELNSGGKRLPMLPSARPVDPQWKCQKSGDCCTVPKEVVMTKEEAATLVAHAPSTITLQFRPGDAEGFVAMKTGPCPLFIFHTCMVYEHRPYNCRRFLCMRPDPKSEPLEDEGWKNHMDRVKTNRTMRRLAIRNQAQAQKWAKAHGWEADATRGRREDPNVSDQHGVSGDGQHGSHHKPDTAAQAVDRGHDGTAQGDRRIIWNE